MIIDALINAVFALLSGVTELLPDFELPEWATPDGSLRDLWQTILGPIHGFRGWIPFETLGVVAPILFTIYGLCMGYRAVMFVWGLIKKLPFL